MSIFNALHYHESIGVNSFHFIGQAADFQPGYHRKNNFGTVMLFTSFTVSFFAGIDGEAAA
jgi:hypothetical protein